MKILNMDYNECIVHKGGLSDWLLHLQLLFYPGMDVTFFYRYYTSNKYN